MELVSAVSTTARILFSHHSGFPTYILHLASCCVVKERLGEISASAFAVAIGREAAA